MNSFMLIAALAFVSAVCAHKVKLSGDRQVIFKRLAVPSQWKMSSQADPLQTLEVIFALKQSNLDILSEKFNAVSDPDNSEYGNFMSRDEINNLVAPKHSDIKAVRHWLRSAGVEKSNIILMGDAISAKMSVRVATELLQTKFYNFVEKRGRMIVRQMGEYSVPVEYSHIIELIAGVSDFPMHRPSSVKDTPNAVDNPFVVPQTINALYNIKETSGSSASQAAAEFQGDSSYSKSDLADFYNGTGIKTNPVSHIVGPFQGNYPDVEATLDIQYITSVGVGAENWYWTESNWMYDFSVKFFNSKSIPQVVSISWGWSEAAQCDISSTCSTLGVDSETYVARTDTEFMKIGLRGTSLISSSGDSGANGRTNGQCYTHKLFPIFPAGSPYVTAVGATQLENAESSLSNPPPVCETVSCASSGTEVAVSHAVAGFTSGGGFSNYHATPSWQTGAVSNFLSTSTKLPPSTYFNSSGRGYPDISALGNKFLIYVNGQVNAVGGTSASAPTIGGIVSILNKVRADNGQKPLGFLNPFLYKMYAEDPSTFNDVVSGSNICTEDGCGMFCKGFTAQKGWDPVTGLGTPNVQKMIEYMQKSSSSTI